MQWTNKRDRCPSVKVSGDVVHQPIFLWASLTPQSVLPSLIKNKKQPFLKIINASGSSSFLSQSAPDCSWLLPPVLAPQMISALARKTTKNQPITHAAPAVGKHRNIGYKEHRKWGLFFVCYLSCVNCCVTIVPVLGFVWPLFTWKQAKRGSKERTTTCQWFWRKNNTIVQHYPGNTILILAIVMVRWHLYAG